MDFNLAEANKQKGIAAERLVRVREAIDNLAKAIEIDPTHPERTTITLKIGLLAKQMGDHAEAVRRFREALELSPDHPDRAAIQGQIDQLNQ